MRGLFHACAALLLVTAIWLNASAPPRPGEASLESVIGVVQRAGYSVGERGVLPAGDAWARFHRPDCAGELTVVILHSVHRPSDMSKAMGWLRLTAGPPTMIYAGRRLDAAAAGLSANWLRVKAATYLRLRRASAWDSSALAYASPPGCRAPLPDWARLQGGTP